MTSGLLHPELIEEWRNLVYGQGLEVLHLTKRVATVFDAFLELATMGRWQQQSRLSGTMHKLSFCFPLLNTCITFARVHHLSTDAHFKKVSATVPKRP